MTDQNVQSKPIRVAFYIRVSTDEQAEKYGLDMQRHALDAILQSRGTLDDGVTPSMILADEKFVYVDQISGTTPLADRPGFSRLQEDVLNSNPNSPPFDMVAVFKIDRFARKLKILLEIIDFFKDHNIQFISVHESIDTSTPFGRAILGIVGVLSELEMETINLRMSGGRKESILNGTFVGNTPPYGYIKEDKILKILPSEAEIVRQIYDFILIEEAPLNAICKYLEERQIESPGVSAVKLHKRKGKIRKKSNPYFWSTPTLTKILTNEVYTGKYYYDKHKSHTLLPKSEWKVSPYRFDPIIDDGTFYRVQEKLEARKKTYIREIKPDDHVYLLGGLLKCACCYKLPRDEKTGMQSWHGEPKEIGKGSGKYSYYYKCRRKNSSKSSIRCGSLPLPAEQIEQYVVDRMSELLANPEVVFEYQKNLNSAKLERKKLENDKRDFTRLLNGIPQVEKALKDQNTHGIITLPDLMSQLGDLATKRDNYEKKIKELVARIASNKLDEGYIRTLELFDTKYKAVLTNIQKDRDQIKQFLHMIVDHIEIFSRPINDNDVVAGRRSKDQMIPHKIVIFLRLPQEYLKMLEAQIEKDSQQFGVNLTNLSG